MNERQAAFVEDMGHYLASVGMTPMSGRMLAWMLISTRSSRRPRSLRTTSRRVAGR